MRVFITGINGFIGRALAKEFINNNIEVCGSSHTGKLDDELKDKVTTIRKYAFGDVPDPLVFKDVDTVIHCALSYTERNYIKTNVNGTVRAFNAAEKAGVKSQIFLTSYSAKDNSESEYAAVKFELENFFREKSERIVRPGLVAGNGGMFRRMSLSVKRSFMLPMLNSGKEFVPLISVDHLCKAMLKIVREGLEGEFNLFYERQFTMRELVLGLKDFHNTSLLLIPVPADLIYYIVRFFEKLKLPVPVKSSSIKALKENQKLDITSSLKEFDISEDNLDSILDSLR